jgi:hypothetical protein
MADIDATLELFNRNKPASTSVIRQTESRCGLRLPTEYVDFLLKADGGEGFLPGGRYVILWEVEKLIELNEAYEVAEYAPGLLVFGSDGGGEAVAFDYRSASQPIVSVPFVGMDLAEARPLAPTFNSFLCGAGAGQA